MAKHGSHLWLEGMQACLSHACHICPGIHLVCKTYSIYAKPDSCPTLELCTCLVQCTACEAACTQRHAHMLADTDLHVICWFAHRHRHINSPVSVQRLAGLFCSFHDLHGSANKSSYFPVSATKSMRAILQLCYIQLPPRMQQHHQILVLSLLTG